MPGRRTIRLLRVSSVDVDSVPSFAAYGRLVAISFALASWWRNNDFVDYEDADLSALLMVIAQCQSLEGLNLCGSPVKDNELVHLSAMTNCRHLDLSRTDITNEGLVHLARTKSLRKLQLEDTR